MGTRSSVGVIRSLSYAKIHIILVWAFLYSVLPESNEAISKRRPGCGVCPHPANKAGKYDSNDTVERKGQQWPCFFVWTVWITYFNLNFFIRETATR
jgi:hypothetical protein